VPGRRVDLVRDSVRLGVAGVDRNRGERADRRRPLPAHRDPGHRPQRIEASAAGDPGRAGDVQLRIPKLRKGSFSR
jgi:transposase-like protein